MFWNQDFSYIKSVPVAKVSEHFNVEFRLEMYNAFNHPTFQNPGSTTGDTTNSLTNTLAFGQLRNLTDTSRGGGVNSRNMALQLRINF